LAVESARIRPVVIARVHEVALKGRNRSRFMRTLTGNIMVALSDVPYRSIKIRTGRILVVLENAEHWPLVRERIARVFGIQNFSLTLESDTRIASILRATELLLEADGPPSGTFCVRVKRPDKTYPLTSPEVERQVGGFIHDRTGAPVQLRQPEITYQIEILHEGAYVTSRVHPGPGGLPVGSSGEVVSLISGGFDSPVATFRMLKRGCSVTLVHFHAYPFVRSTSIEKVVELAQSLGRSQPEMRLVTVPIGDLQRQMAISCESEMLVVLYRRLMLRIAEAIATEYGAGALVTGESLGQVASQTLQNIRAIESAVQLTILRPLIGMDKIEILEEAARIGTEEISRTPDDDCCTVFVPRHPATHATIEQAERAEASLDIEALVHQALSRKTVFEGNPAKWNVMRALRQDETSEPPLSPIELPEEMLRPEPTKSV
jgi:thiamine biosynthesis protein ThiI